MKTKKIPSRICVGCKQAKEKQGLIRVVKNAEQKVSLDETGRMNGRGAYICKNTACLELALKSKGLERSLKTVIPAELIASLREEMKEIEAR